ncbi:MAG: glutaminyl-peptide cyclotransferase [Bacteroidales bacterium]|nr:glutaminyl-peptide cyclotransferase [Bacteroidales bacterium]
MKLKFFYSLLISAVVLYSCQEEDKTKSSTNSDTNHQQVSLEQVSNLKIVAPVVGQVFKQSDAVIVRTQSIDSEKPIDSLQFWLNNQAVVIDSVLDNSRLRAGRNNLRIKAFNVDGTSEEKSIYFTCVADHQPKKIKVSKVKTYPHDVTAYTQGLIFVDGFLYEGTGQRGESMLKKINLSKNELIQSYNLPAEVFGEGIVERNGKIFQLTWQSRKAYEYDLKTFALVDEFTYNSEGWGITNYFGNLIMSDGTQNLYILDPESFSVIDQLQVMNNIGPVNNLNEMEWIEDKIWANVYLTNTIVQIDPKTGFVEAEMDLTDLVPDTYANPHDNVLNGIAYDKKSKKIYVTGKRWPVLYEIEVNN